MATPTCALCGIEITADNQSREHIIQQAIGGRKEVPNVLCRTCNSTTGNQWDSAAAYQLRFLSLKLQIARQDGDVPAEDFQALDAKPVRLHPDGHLTRPPQKPTVTEQNGQVHIQINAPNRREAVKALKGQKRLYPKLDVEAGIRAMVQQETYLQAPVFATLQFGDDASHRSVVKSALTLAVASGISSQSCERALQYLRPNGDFCFGYYYKRDLIVARPTDRVFHCVAIKGDPSLGKLIGYVELFSTYRFVICLSETYRGALIENSYSIDPTIGKVIDLTFDLTFSEEEFRYAVENQDETSYTAMVAALERVVAPALDRSFEREQARVFSRAYGNTLEKLGLETGQPMTQEIAVAMSREITREILPFMVHKISSGRLGS
jgi:hypothetical protein